MQIITKANNEMKLYNRLSACPSVQIHGSSKIVQHSRGTKRGQSGLEDEITVHAKQAYRRHRDTAPAILNSTLNTGELSTSRFGRFNPRGKPPVTTAQEAGWTTQPLRTISRRKKSLDENKKKKGSECNTHAVVKRVRILATYAYQLRRVCLSIRPPASISADPTGNLRMQTSSKKKICQYTQIWSKSDKN